MPADQPAADGPLFIGVDVGTGSVRAGVFDARGRLFATAKRPIATWHEDGGIVEQSSTDIWIGCLGAIRSAVAEAGVAPGAIAGIGFDATCSLVVLDAAGRPLPVGPSGDPMRDVIVWMDHRALDQTRRINAGGDPVLDYVGGRLSPEMETPKLLWLKETMPDTFDRAGHFFDLADFLAFRATGSTARSLCTVTCKWTFLAHEGRWSPEYFRAIGLGELAEEGFRRIGTEMVAPGTAIGTLTEEAAAGMLLPAGVVVAAPLIDAHAGGLGTVAAPEPDGGPGDPTRRLGYVFGTSACIMASTAAPSFVPGVWGPYFSAMVPGFWLNEGGQSAAGAALDHVVRSHPAYPALAAAAAAEGRTALEHLEARVVARTAGLSEAARLAAGVHVLPEHLGNRAPHADPEARAAILGLDLDESTESLEVLYVAALCGLAYGFADVVDALAEKGTLVDRVVISGGAAKSPLLRQILADATGLAVSLPASPEPVLLGAAMLAAAAAGAYPSVTAAAAAMSRLGPSTAETPARIALFHGAKRRVYALMQDLDREARGVMATA